MVDIWANSVTSVACHPRATCHIAGCSHLGKSLIFSVMWHDHDSAVMIVPHCTENRFSPYFIYLFITVLKCSLGFDERRLSCRLRYTCTGTCYSWYAMSRRRRRRRNKTGASSSSYVEVITCNDCNHVLQISICINCVTDDTEYTRPDKPKYIWYKAGNCVKKFINVVQTVPLLEPCTSFV